MVSDVAWGGGDQREKATHWRRLQICVHSEKIRDTVKRLSSYFVKEELFSK